MRSSTCSSNSFISVRTVDARVDDAGVARVAVECARIAPKHASAAGQMVLAPQEGAPTQRLYRGQLRWAQARDRLLTEPLVDHALAVHVRIVPACERATRAAGVAGHAGLARRRGRAQTPAKNTQVNEGVDAGSFLVRAADEQRYKRRCVPHGISRRSLSWCSKSSSASATPSRSLISAITVPHGSTIRECP